MAPPTTGPIRTMLTHMSPTWMSREFGEKFVLGLMGYMGDALLEASLNATRAPWLLEETSPQDAVDLQVYETGLRRYPSETDAEHRARVQDPWTTWGTAGSKDGTGGVGEGIEGQLHLAGYPNAFTMADYEWTFDADSGVWWSRFWVIIPASDHSWTDDGAWDDPGVYDDGYVWDMTATEEEIRSLRQLIRTFKGAHDICPSIIVMRDGELWDFPSGLWSDPGNWDDGDQPFFIKAS